MINNIPGKYSRSFLVEKKLRMFKTLVFQGFYHKVMCICWCNAMAAGGAT